MFQRTFHLLNTGSGAAGILAEYWGNYAAAQYACRVSPRPKRRGIADSERLSGK